MRSFEKRQFQRESDLLKIYREADACAKYLNDTDEKILDYHKVIGFCLNSEKCLENETCTRRTKDLQQFCWRGAYMPTAD